MTNKRKRLHLRLKNRSSKSRYAPPKSPPYPTKEVIRRKMPAKHAATLTAQLTKVQDAMKQGYDQRNPNLKSDNLGTFITFELLEKSDSALASLEDRRLGVELATVIDAGTEIKATLFVPDAQADKYFDTLTTKVREYGKSEGKKNKKLVDELDKVVLKDVTSLYTGSIGSLPDLDELVWWELWLSTSTQESIFVNLSELQIEYSEEILRFPDRMIVLARTNLLMLQELYKIANLMELRLFQDEPTVFLDMSNPEAKDWIDDVINRYIPADEPKVKILILDGGTNREHVLLNKFIDFKDWHCYLSSWGPEENSTRPGIRGHGTAMAGLSLYGDLTDVLLSSNIKKIDYGLETYKILPPSSNNDKRLWGAITERAVHDVEAATSFFKRVICMAVTSDHGTYYGKPSSWSASIDQLAFGSEDDDLRRLIILSAGNIKSNINPKRYVDYIELNREVDSQIENPAQAWNALSVGAYTEKSDSFALFRGFQNYAPHGDLSPRSRTSFAWSNEWPIKPEIVLEGGNYLSDGTYVNREPSVSLLTTHYDSSAASFDIFTDTSAATALAANLAAELYATYPSYWPETIRGLIVHSANWTKAMKSRLVNTNTSSKVDLLRQYGYGVPNISEAMHSLDNKVTVVAEHRIKPFVQNGDSMGYGEIGFHNLPWLDANIDKLENEKMTMRVTLSYFIEPNPSSRGYIARYRYGSHALRFDLKRTNESPMEFRQRMNASLRGEDYESSESKPGNWMLGPQLRKMSGSIFSDWWTGPAIELAKCDQVAVFPVGGWWKARTREPYASRSARYSLIISLYTHNPNNPIDIYTPIETAIEIPISIET